MNKYIKILGLSTLVTSWIIMMWTFIGAYAEPSKSILVTIDSVHEANWEVVVLTLCAVCVIIYVIQLVRGLNEDK